MPCFSPSFNVQALSCGTASTLPHHRLTDLPFRQHRPYLDFEDDEDERASLEAQRSPVRSGGMDGRTATVLVSAPEATQT
jgi:hypothetical protein